MTDTPAVTDPTDTSSGPAWLDTLKSLTRPVGCWVIYVCTALTFAAILKLALEAKALDSGTLAAIFGLLGSGWAHVYQYTWARSAEKKANAD